MFEQWDRIDPLLSEALSLPETERESLVEQRCAGDETLRQTVLDMLTAALTDSPVIRPGGAIGPELCQALAGADDQLGSTFGSYRLIREIGSGGMAQVYLARRIDGLFDQEVALKLMWPGLLRPDLLARFEQERRILARLNDPYIARLLDGGLSDDGRPWLAMEYISGERIDHYCDRQRLTLDQRLELVQDVIAAVTSAHRQGVIHRDIKPSNVMVTAQGQVKLVDFGIAKLIEEDARGAAAVTHTGSRILTPEYASPEQLEARPIGVASDIYQLGVLLFELVTGQRPFDSHNRSPVAFQQQVVETPAPLPSRTARHAHFFADHLDVKPGGLARALAGELDAIILKALEKDPTRRYRNAKDLAADLRNYHAGLPVSVGSANLCYRTRKFMARHRIGVALSAAFAALLIAYASTVTVLAGKIAAERDIAQLESARSQEIASFMQNLFQYASPATLQGQEMSIRQMVDRGAEQLRERLANQPELKAAMLENLGISYRYMGEYEAALDQYRLALALREQLTHPGHISTTAALHGMAGAKLGLGQFDAAIEDLERVLAIRRAVHGEDHLSLAGPYRSLAITHSQLGEKEIAAKYHQRVLALRQKYLPADDLDLTASMADYGVVLHRQGKKEQAQTLYRQALETMEEKLGPAHPSTLRTLRNLAVLVSDKDLPEAERMFQEVLRREQMIYQGDHPKMASTLGFLGKVAEEQNDYERAEAHWREAVRVLSTTLPNRHLHTAGATHGLAKVLMQNNKTAEACELLEWSLGVRLETRGDDASATTESRLYLAQCQAQLGDYERARQLVLQAEPHVRRTKNTDLLASTKVILSAQPMVAHYRKH